MFTMLAVLVYVAAMAIPIYLLHHYHSQAWHWHVLAVIASIVLGLAPLPDGFQGRGFDLMLGFVFVSLLFWGAGGLLVYHPAHHKHA
ncbi:MAG TPA: hypothetical protein VMH81_22265 [Bryobacteraceae bacterium]|nr:hypothetical protein [Bryobacteraceae bacterium]